MRPLPRQNLRLHAPAGDVGDGECSLEIVGPRAGIVLLQQIDGGSTDNLAHSLAEAEHALERGQLAVDGGVGRVLLLTVSDIGEDPVG